MKFSRARFSDPSENPPPPIATICGSILPNCIRANQGARSRPNGTAAPVCDKNLKAATVRCKKPRLELKRVDLVDCVDMLSDMLAKESNKLIQKTGLKEQFEALAAKLKQDRQLRYLVLSAALSRKSSAEVLRKTRAFAELSTPS